ncbi:hypothetical protein [Halegenticoccus soli]|uniref:hypothetical protein n=1 Tax=Halegenticoccus soli TaxID=1985678 RepID=UPI001E4A2903|nr:hypothetical protein [Halegenticoccus soli]
MERTSTTFARLVQDNRHEPPSTGSGFDERLQFFFVEVESDQNSLVDGFLERGVELVDLLAVETGWDRSRQGDCVMPALGVQDDATVNGLGCGVGVALPVITDVLFDLVLTGEPPVTLHAECEAL